MYHVPLALQCILESSDEGGENGDGEEGSEICTQMTWVYAMSRRET